MSQRPQSGRGSASRGGNPANGGRGRGRGGPHSAVTPAALGTYTFTSQGEWKHFWDRVKELAASNEAEIFSLEFNRNCIVELAAMLHTMGKAELKKHVDNADLYIRSGFQMKFPRAERCKDYEHIGFKGNSCYLSVACPRMHMIHSEATDFLPSLAEVNKGCHEAQANLRKKHHGRVFAVGENIHFILDRQSERVDPALTLLHERQDQLQAAEVVRVLLHEGGRLGLMYETATQASMAYTTARLTAKEKGTELPLMSDHHGGRSPQPLAVSPKGAVAIGCEVNSSFPVIAIDPIQTKLFDDAFRVSTHPLTDGQLERLARKFPALELSTERESGADEGSKKRYRMLTLEVFTPNIWDQVIAGGDDLLNEKQALEARMYLDSIYLGNKSITKLWPRFMGPKCSLSPDEPRPCIVCRSTYLYDNHTECVVCFLPHDDGVDAEEAEENESCDGGGVAPVARFSMDLDFVKPNYQLEYEIVDRFLKSKTRKVKNAVEYSLKLADRLATFLTTPAAAAVSATGRPAAGSRAAESLGLDAFCAAPWADSVRLDHSGRDRYGIKVQGNVRGHSRGHFIVDTFVDTVNYAGGQVFLQHAAATPAAATVAPLPATAGGDAVISSSSSSPADLPSSPIPLLDRVLVQAPAIPLSAADYAQMEETFKISYGEDAPYASRPVSPTTAATATATATATSSYNFDAVSCAFHQRGVSLTDLRAGMGLENGKAYYTMSQWAEQPVELTHDPAVSLTKPLRSYSCAYHQYLLLNILDPVTDRSAIAHWFPQSAEEIKHLQRDLTTRYQGHRRAKQDKDLSVAAVLYDLFPTFSLCQTALIIPNMHRQDDGRFVTARLCSDHGKRLGPIKVLLTDCRENGGKALDVTPGKLVTAVCFRGNVVALRDAPPKQSMTSLSHRLLRGVNA